MIADLKPYPEYKESGIAWLGRVPRHWVPTRLKHAFKRIIGGSTPASGNSKYWDGDVIWVTPADVSRSERLRRSIRRISRVGVLSCSTEMVPKGSIIITSRAPVGNVAIAEVDLCTNQGCKALIPDHTVVAPMFGFWLLSMMKAELQSLSTGTTFSEVSTSRLGSAFGVLPLPDEQAAIVRFLDWANVRLERAIRAKRKVIALLNEQKQVIIHRAVTRGVDPSVPLKPSGIPWLGHIPQHWEVLRSKYIYREVDNRSTAGEETHLSMSQKFGLIPSSQIEEKRLVSESYAGAKLCEKGDLVLNRLKAHLGVFAIAPEHGLVSPDYTVLRPVRELEERYFEAVYRTPACRVELRQRAKGIVQGFWRLYTDDFYNIRMPVPPVGEQKCIMVQLDIDLSGVNTAVNRLESEIELLREYRTRLVADVVTGKLDVREAARGLPATSEESGSPAEAPNVDHEELEEILPAEIAHE